MKRSGIWGGAATFGHRLDHPATVIPAKAGIQWMLVFRNTKAVWIPAFAGMTVIW